MTQHTEDGLSKRTIHEIYWAVILFAIIIVLASVQWYRVDKLVELVSFSLTITSLVLAIIAIGYAIFSGSSIERGVHNLLVAVQSVRSSANDIEALRDTLTREVRAVADAVGGVANSVTQQSDAFSKFSEQRLIDVQAAMETSAQAETTEDIKIEGPKLSVRRLLVVGSLSGGFGILATARCRELGREVDLKAALQGTVVEGPYIHGYLVALAALDVFQLNLDEDRISEVTRDLEMTAADIKAALVHKIESADFGEGSKKRLLNDLISFDDRLKEDALVVKPKADETQVSKPSDA